MNNEKVASVSTSKKSVETQHALTPSSKRGRVSPTEVHSTLSKHMLIDGFDLVVDLERSQGSYIYDSRYNKRYLDFFTFFGSGAVGINHPKMTTPEFIKKLAQVAVNKVSNSDSYTVEMAEFVDTFGRVAIPEYLPYAFFIEGGALGVENALKVAFDWKVRKNFIKGYKEERGRQVIHFRRAFHGRSGYTMSLTNTDPTKTNYYPKFKWPRITNPAIKFPLNEKNLVEDVPAQARAGMTFHLVDSVDQVLALALDPAPVPAGPVHKELLASHN